MQHNIPNCKRLHRFHKFATDEPHQSFKLKNYDQITAQFRLRFISRLNKVSNTDDVPLKTRLLHKQSLNTAAPDGIYFLSGKEEPSIKQST